MPSKTTWVIAQDLIRVIFEDMDPIWLRTMCEEGGSTRADMIEILISLALLKLRFRLWSFDLLWTMLYGYLRLYYFLGWSDDQYIWWLCIILWWCDTYLWYCCVMFHLLSLNPIVFSKVFCYSFLVTMRKVFSRRSCLRGTWLGWRVVGSIIS